MLKPASTASRRGTRHPPPSSPRNTSKPGISSPWGHPPCVVWTCFQTLSNHDLAPENVTSFEITVPSCGVESGKAFKLEAAIPFLISCHGVLYVIGLSKQFYLYLLLLRQTYLVPSNILDRAASVGCALHPETISVTGQLFVRLTYFLFGLLGSCQSLQNPRPGTRCGK